MGIRGRGKDLQGCHDFMALEREWVHGGDEGDGKLWMGFARLLGVGEASPERL